VGTRVFTEYPQNRLLTGFVVFTAASLMYAYVQMIAFTAFRTHLDYLGLFAMSMYLTDRVDRLRRFSILWSFILIVLVVLNLDKLTAVERVSGFKGAYFFGDGNDFAWGLLVLMPIAIYASIYGRWLGRLLGPLAILGTLFAVIGTQSRGATLALGASTLYYWVVVAKRKALGLVAVVGLVLAVLLFAPAHYWERMNTMQNYSEDGSASARLVMWGVAIRMATDNPLGVGAGNFSQAYGMEYRTKLQRAGHADAPDRWLGAHSVYFRALGEYGVLGPILIITIIILNFATNFRSMRTLRARAVPGQIPDQWPALLNMSVVAYSVAGMFLGGLTYPHLYLLSGLTLSARRFVEFGEQQDSGTQPQGSGTPTVRKWVSRKAVPAEPPPPAPAPVAAAPRPAPGPRAPAAIRADGARYRS
jgi:O-antigen ligase